MLNGFCLTTRRYKETYPSSFKFTTSDLGQRNPDSQSMISIYPSRRLRTQSLVWRYVNTYNVGHFHGIFLQSLQNSVAQKLHCFSKL